MNIITNQPINNVYRMNKISNNRPAFTAKPKTPTGAEIKKGLNIAQKCYDMMFVPFGEKLKMVKDGHVFTERKTDKKSILIGKKYKLWSKEPEMTMRNDLKTGIQTRATHKGEVNDIEIRDLHTPGHEISVGYRNVSKDFDILSNEEPMFWGGGDYKGDISIKYGDKKINISNEERERIGSELEKANNEKYNFSIKELTSLGYEKFQEFLTGYYQDPKVIGRAILSSPASLEHQVSTIPSSMPYGIEEIMKHVK